MKSCFNQFTTKTTTVSSSPSAKSKARSHKACFVCRKCTTPHNLHKLLPCNLHLPKHSTLKQSKKPPDFDSEGKSFFSPQFFSTIYASYWLLCHTQTLTWNKQHNSWIRSKPRNDDTRFCQALAKEILIFYIMRKEQHIFEIGSWLCY